MDVSIFFDNLNRHRTSVINKRVSSTSFKKSIKTRNMRKTVFKSFMGSPDVFRKSGKISKLAINPRLNQTISNFKKREPSFAYNNYALSR